MSYVFDLVCLECGRVYEHWYNNGPCECGETERIRWTLKPEHRGKCTNPGECTIENMQIEVDVKVKIPT